MNHIIMVRQAGVPDIDKQLGNRVDGDISDTRSRAHRIAFHQQIQDLRLVFEGELVHAYLFAQALNSV